jgi:hypothetical protein
MAENIISTAILAKRADMRESHPNMEDMSPNKIALLSIITRAITEAANQGTQTLNQYGSLKIAGLAAIGAGVTGATLETASAFKN